MSLKTLFTALVFAEDPSVDLLLCLGEGFTTLDLRLDSLVLRPLGAFSLVLALVLALEFVVDLLLGLSEGFTTLDLRLDSLVLRPLVSSTLVRPVQPGLVVVVELPLVLGDVNNSPSDVRRDLLVLLTYPLTPALF